MLLICRFFYPLKLTDNYFVQMAVCDLTDFKNEIISVPSENPVFIYIGVGTAAGMLNAQGILPQEHYHQFPPFLQNLRNEIKNVHLFLLLIDPQQENPPYLTRDFPVVEVELNHYKSVSVSQNQRKRMDRKRMDRKEFL